MLKTRAEEYVIVGDYDPETEDKNTSIQGRFCKRPGERDRLMIQQAELDGSGCKVIQPVDPGASGQHSFREISKMFMKEGFMVSKDPMPTNKSKLKKFEPFSSAAQNGLISIVESTFTKQTLEYFYKELESFDGERSSASKKDDMCDCAASVFNHLCVSKSRKPMSAGTSTATKLAEYRNQS